MYKRRAGEIAQVVVLIEHLAAAHHAHLAAPLVVDDDVVARVRCVDQLRRRHR